MEESTDGAGDPGRAENAECEGVIAEVSVQPENIFNLEDPDEDKSLFRLANKLHIRTQPRIIRQQLLFRPGDQYSLRLLEESERILRDKRYLYDAAVRPIACRHGRVDVEVVTRDVWTRNPGVSFGRSGGKNATGVEVEELNLFGTGTKLSMARTSNVDRGSALLEYQNEHVGGTWAALDAAYASNSDGFARA